MTPSNTDQDASTQDVLTTLRDLLNTLRTVLARMPISPGGASGDAATTVGALELSQILHTVPRKPDTYAHAIKPFFDEWGDLQRRNAVANAARSAATNAAALKQAKLAQQPKVQQVTS